MIIGKRDAVGCQLVRCALPRGPARPFYCRRRRLGAFVFVMTHLEESLELRHMTMMLTLRFLLFRVLLAAEKPTTLPVTCLQITRACRPGRRWTAERRRLCTPFEVTAAKDKPLVELRKVLRLRGTLAAGVRIIRFSYRRDGARGGVVDPRGGWRAFFLRVGIRPNEELRPMFCSILRVRRCLRDIALLRQVVGRTRPRSWGALGRLALRGPAYGWRHLWGHRR